MNPIVDLINEQQKNIDTQKTFTFVLNNTGSNLEKLQIFGTLEDYTKAFIAPQGSGKTYSLQKTTKRNIKDVTLGGLSSYIPSFPRIDQFNRLIHDRIIDFGSALNFDAYITECKMNPEFEFENVVTGSPVNVFDVEFIRPKETLQNFDINLPISTYLWDKIANADLSVYDAEEYGLIKYVGSVNGVSSTEYQNVVTDVQLVETGGSSPISSNIIIDGTFNENLRATAILPEKTIAGLWNYLLSKELTLKGIQFKLENGVQANNNQFVELYEYSPFLTEPNFVKNIQAYKNGYQRQSNIYDIFGLNWQLDKLKYLTIPNFQGTTVITLFF